MSTEILSLEVREDGTRVVRRSMESLGAAAENSGKKVDGLKKDLDGLKGSISPVNQLKKALRGIGVGLVLKASIASSLAFGSAMDEVSTLVDEANFSMQKLTESARAQSIEFASSPLTQSKALYQIISAGAKDSTQAIKILTASNKLAVGGVTDVATAADGLTTILNAYGDKAGTATDVSDALFVGMRAGKTTIEELSSSLGKVAPLAEALNVPFDELVAATSALTKGGISTRESITGLRAVLASVAKPSKEASDLAHSLGIEFNIAGIQSMGLAGFMQHLAEKTGGSKEALTSLFGGVEALIPVMALSGKAGESFAEILGDMENKAGATEAALKKITDGNGFKFQQFLTFAKEKMISLGDTIVTVLAPVLSTLVNRFDDLVLAGGAFLAVMSIANIGAIAGAFKTASLAVYGFTVALAANPIGLIVVGISAAVSALVFFRNEIKLGSTGFLTLRDFAVATFDIIREKIKPVYDAMKSLFSDIKVLSRDAFASLGTSFDGVLDGIKTFINKMIGAVLAGGDVIYGIFKNTLHNVKALFTNDKAIGLDEFLTTLNTTVTETFNKDYIGSFVTNIKTGFDAIEERALKLKGIRDALEKSESLGLNSKGKSSDIKTETIQQVDPKIAGAIAEINRQLGIERDLLLETSPAARDVKAQLLSIQSELEGKNIFLSDDQIEQEFAGMLKLNNQLAERADVIDAVIGPQEKFTAQLKAISDLVNSGTISEGAGIAQINDISNGLLEGTAELQSAYVQQWTDTYDQIDQLRQADLISEQTANLLKFKADSEYINLRLQGYKEGFSALEILSTSNNSKVAAIGKAAAITNATIDTYKAATGAYSSLSSIPYVGPALGAAAAAAAIAAGLANVAKIRSAQPTARALGGDLNAGQASRVGESSFGRAEMFTGVSGQQIFIPPERGRVEPLKQSSPRQEQSNGGNAESQNGGVNVINVIDPKMMETYLTSQAGRKTLINLIGEESSGINSALQN